MFIRSHFVLADNPIVIQEADQSKLGKVTVHISGCVIKQGVYTVNCNDRVIDVVKLAGGARNNADLGQVNLAEMVKDGQKITIPVKEILIPEAKGEKNKAKKTKTTKAGKINLNTADEKALCQVNGIGPSTAKKIIEYRKQNGAFSQIEALLKVKGIGKRKFEKMKGEIQI
jgi:competence protein ComEA